MRIDCETCDVRGAACEDCVVAVLLGDPRVPTVLVQAVAEPPGLSGPSWAPASVTDSDPLGLDAADRVALSSLAEVGLLPPTHMIEARADPRQRHSA